jgi:hypothetical protein
MLVIQCGLVTNGSGRRFSNGGRKEQVELRLASIEQTANLD